MCHEPAGDSATSEKWGAACKPFRWDFDFPAVGRFPSRSRRLSEAVDAFHRADAVSWYVMSNMLRAIVANGFVIS